MKRKEKLTRKQKIYILLCICFIAGIFLGTIFANFVEDNKKNEIIQYIQNFFSTFNYKSINQGYFLKNSLINNSKLLLIFWIFCFHIICIPIIFLLVLVRGFMYGFTSAFFVKYYGFKGLVFIIVSYFPQILIVIPIVIATAGFIIDFIIEKRNNKNKLKSHNKKPEEYIQISLLIFIGILSMFLVSIIETYITPILVGFIHL